MKSLTLATVQSEDGLRTSRRPLVRLLSAAPAALLLSGLFAVWAGPLAAPLWREAPRRAWSPAGAAPTGARPLLPRACRASPRSPPVATTAWPEVERHGRRLGQQRRWPDRRPGRPVGRHRDLSRLLPQPGPEVERHGRRLGFQLLRQTNVPAGLSGVIAIAAGYYHSLALKSDGTVVAWGATGVVDYGQADVPAGLSGVTAIAAGGSHSLALKSDGTVVAWGAASSGSSAIWTMVRRRPGRPIGRHAIAAGGFHSLA